MTKTVGIPRGLFYYKYFPIWETFFRELGAELLLSPPTNKRILDSGVRACVGEACLPVKVYFGHVAEIMNRTDLLFIPRYTSIHRREYICPKFGGLPDMVRGTFAALPPLIDAEINLRSSRRAVHNAVSRAAEVLGAGSAAASRAYGRALSRYESVRRDYPRGVLPGQWDRKPAAPDPEDGRCRILLMGHPYMVYDRFVNMDVMAKIRSLGGRALTLEMADKRRFRTAARALTKPIFWSYGMDALGCAYDLAAHGGAEGVIYLTSFGCGIDSFACYMAERRIRGSGIPFTILTIDEHTAEAGLNTRLEAFMDTISRRKSNDCHLSAHG